MSTTPNQKDLLAKKSDLEGILKPDDNDVLHLPDVTITLAESGQFYLAGIDKKLLTLVGNTSGNAVTLDGDAGLTFTTSGGSNTITGITSSSGNSTSLAASQSMASAKQDKIIAGTNIQIAQDGKTISATDTNELENLTDVNITTPTDGQGLVYNNTTQKWENGNVSSASSIDTLTDVYLTNLTDGQILKYDSTNQEWINANDSGGGSLAELSDVNISTPVNGQGLIYDATNNEWINGTVQSGGGARQDVLYVASTMAETQISIDFTEYDEYIIYANDVLITQQIPQGVSFPKTVIEKAIADNSNITIYGYSSAACAYTVTSNSLTKISSSGDYTITMIVGVNGGSGHMDTLWTGDVNPTSDNAPTVQLANPLSNYNYIVVEGYGTYSYYTTDAIYKPVVGRTYVGNLNGEISYCAALTIINDSNVRLNYWGYAGSNTHIVGIYGVKI